MAEKKDITKLSKVELVEMLQRQEKLLNNGTLIRSLPDKGQKIKESIEKLKDMIAKREKADDLTASFQQISISQPFKISQQNATQLDSDDDEDDSNIITSEMDNESKDTVSTSPKGDISDNSPQTKSEGLSNTVSKQQKKDNWSYDSAVTYARQPKFEKSKVLSLEESLKLQKDQKQEYEALRAKQAAQSLKQYRNPASSSSNYTFTSQEAKDRYRDTVTTDEIQDNDEDSESENIVQEQEDSDDD